MESIWEQTTRAKNFEELKGNIKTDILIVGGGITGILCAYFLSKAGIECVLVEADHICKGVTSNTTAKITLQHGLIYNKITKSVTRKGSRFFVLRYKSLSGFVIFSCGKRYTFGAIYLLRKCGILSHHVANGNISYTTVYIAFDEIKYIASA